MRVVYYDHAAQGAPQTGFRSGEAGGVRFTPDGGVETDVQVRIESNSLHALEGHGMVAALRSLPLVTGAIVPGRDAVLSPLGFEAASRILHEADRNTYGAVHEFMVCGSQVPEPVQYRIVIDNREYQRTLARLQYLVTRASREGFGVRLRL